MRRTWPYIVLGIASLIFVTIYLFLYIFPSVNSLSTVQFAGRDEPGILVLNQPDESINYLFIRERVLHNRARIPEPLSIASNQQLHPRSTTVIHNEIVPIGFPGLIVLYSGIIKLFLSIFGLTHFNFLAVLLTPIFAAITPIIFYAWLKEWFDKNLALLSALLLYILPPWWYYASRPFQHSITFIFFLMIALLAITKWIKSKPDRKKIIWIFIAGLAVSSSLYIRPSETVWISAIFLLIIIFHRRELRMSHAVALLLGISMIAGLFFATQKLFYGSPFASGYVKPATDGSGGLITNDPQGISLIKAFLLPFGFHPTAIIRTTYEYFFHLFAPWFILAIAGLMFFWRDQRKKYYAWVFAGVSSFLLAYYGSWLFFDNIARVYSIGSSQVRYFLPMYVFSVPCIAYSILSLPRLGWSGKLTAAMIMLILAVTSLRSVMFRFEGLYDIKNTVADYYDWQNRIERETPKESVIITRYADKYLYPQRHVLTDWSEESLSAAENLARLGFPLYWYDLKLNSAAEFDLSQKLLPYHLNLSKPISNWSDLELRKLSLEKEVN